MPKALADPIPADGWGLLLAPVEILSNVQAVRVVEALIPDREASITDTMHASFLILI